MQAMIRRHLLTAAIAVSSAALLYGGITFAREQEIRDDRVPQVAATTSPSFDDRGGLLESEAPDDRPTASDDDGDDLVVGTPEPTESFDDHGGRGGGSDDRPTASPDDHGGTGGGSDDASPTASPDDNGGTGSDDGPRATSSPSASPSPSASADDKGGHGSDD